ncbi:MAG: RluA family pseudouridine synthase [Lachnospiraceae bacterium]|nr:RluA family pseudouridine synthase [Lachnospiraceae bacterium]
MRLIVDKTDFVNKRLDNFIKENSELSRTYIASLIEDGYVKVNDVIVCKPSYKTKELDIIDFEERENTTLDVVPENIPLKIIYEDDDILIIDKERGMVVHPSNGHHSGTLVNAIMYHCKDNLSSINGVIRPGIVHRIDKDTSGILCVCKNDESHKSIAKQFSEHSNIRKYFAITKGAISKDSGTIEKPIGRDKRNRLRMAVDTNGKEAITKYKVIKKYKDYSYIECELLTGRTHQIRVHMKDMGYPLLGDLTYGKVDRNFKELNGQILHAHYLEFSHPRTNERVSFESKLPDYFVSILDKLDKINE